MIRNLTPRPAEKGRIKIGGLGEERKKRDGSGSYMLPVKYDHFEIVTMQRDAAGRFIKDTELMDRLMKAQGVQKLLEIPIRLLFDDPDLNFFTRYSAYQGTRCVCSGDGVEAQRMGQDGKFAPVPCPCERLEAEFKGQPKCKPLGNLRCLIEGVDRVGGIWSFRTTSWNSVNAILSSLALIKTITGGPLAGIPLTLVLSPKTVTTPDGKSMVAFIVSIEYQGPEAELAELGYEIARRRIEHRVKMETVEVEARKLLVAPHQEPPLEQKETAQEFYPEGVVTEEPQASAATPSQDSGNGGGHGATIQAGQGFVPTRVGQGPDDDVNRGPHLAGSGQDSHESETASITLPGLMEFIKKPTETQISLPIALVTTKGTPIGRWLDYAPNLGGEMQVTLELADNLKEVAQGLTPELIKKSFREAGITLVITTAVDRNEEERSSDPEGGGLQVTELSNGSNGAMKVEIGPKNQDPSQSGAGGKKTHLKSVKGDGETRKSLF